MSFPWRTNENCPSLQIDTFYGALDVPYVPWSPVLDVEHGTVGPRRVPAVGDGGDDVVETRGVTGPHDTDGPVVPTPFSFSSDVSFPYRSSSVTLVSLPPYLSSPLSYTDGKITHG